MLLYMVMTTLGASPRPTRLGKILRYPPGTIVQVCPKNQTCYLVAVADMNENGVAQASFEGVKVTLAELWSFISQRGEMEPIVISIIGTGRGRVTETREQIAKEILKSFVAACAEIKFCEKLTVVISPDDYRIHRIDLAELGKFLRSICLYTEFKTTGGTGEGIGVDEHVGTSARIRPNVRDEPRVRRHQPWRRRFAGRVYLVEENQRAVRACWRRSESSQLPLPGFFGIGVIASSGMNPERMCQ